MHLVPALPLKRLKPHFLPNVACRSGIQRNVKGTEQRGNGFFFSKGIEWTEEHGKIWACMLTSSFAQFCAIINSVAPPWEVSEK